MPGGWPRTGQYEFYRMAQAKGIRPLVAAGIVLGAALIVGGFYHQPGAGTDRHLFYLTVCLLLLLTGRLFSSDPVDRAVEDAAATLLGIVYVALLFGFQIGIRMGAAGKQWIVFLYLVIWATDIGAYSIGIPFGKHKLFPKISPKKSIEGLLGGFAAAAGMALLCRVWFMPPIGIGEAAGIGLLLAAAGTVGDLVESMLKRSAGVKDSGIIIPGHGGMLDRMDSMLFAAPVLYYYLGMR
jgi:phosphatidate cytidylyltransferase